MFKKIYSLQQKIYEFKSRSVDTGVPIFMIHHVSDAPLYEEMNLSIRTTEFKTFIKGLVDAGYQFIRPDQLGESFEKKACMITFDDIFKDALENGISFLEDNHIPYVCFISPGFLGEERYINKSELNGLRKSRYCSIGAHGINHKLFRKLTGNEKLEEISKEKHELLLGCEIEDFAFPYGSLYACDKTSIKMTKEEYLRVYSTLNYQASRDSMYFIPRINLNSKYVWLHKCDGRK